MVRGLSSSRVAGPSASAASNESLSSSRVWTPLRENYFEPPLLSSRERAYLVRKSCEAAQELVERARSAGGPIAWRHVEKNNGVQIYAGSPRSTATGAALTAASMCGVTSVPGTVKEVASLFQLGSTRQMKEFARAHREWFYDGVVLHTLAPRTKEKPLHQVTAKWMVVQMPHGLPHRDFCYLECQDKFIDARGRKGWVLGQHSIKLPGCDELKREFGLINLKEHTPVPVNLLRTRVLFVAQEAQTAEEDLIDRDQLQKPKVEDLIDHEYEQKYVPLKKMNVVDNVARKYTLHGRYDQAENNSNHVNEQELSGTDDEAILNTVGCDMNYLDADMRQFHDQSLFLRQSRDGQAPTVHGERTSQLKDVDENQKSWNARHASKDRVLLDAQNEPSDEDSIVDASTTRTDDRFATGLSLVSTAVDGSVEDLTFERDSDAPRCVAEEADSTPHVIPLSTMLSEPTQTSDDDVSEIRSRASSRISFSSVPSSSARGSSICSMGLDVITPPATPPSASPVDISRLSATSASSPAAVPALSLEASNTRTEVVVPPRNNSKAPAYLPDRFRSTEQPQVMQQNPIPSKLELSPHTPRQSNDSNAALDNFQLNFSASFNAHQEQKPVNTNGVIEGLPNLPPQDERNRASSSGSSDVQVFRYQSAGTSVLDTVPDSSVHSSDEDDSEDENMLLSARQLYGRFGNTKQLSRLGGDRPGFQHTLSQIQQSFDELSDSEDEGIRRR
ncbi:hypothetical protein PHMEG_00021697 [Phytophthora megakarya]|uniref:START domain-containing protein n=1 Tax=Phytophthora megakarya TaxID=4795 RepID=A0A225VM56_9STRA|nr:hypothetical protein PHMEG_00021697 [Phytophthora megakarya]